MSDISWKYKTVHFALKKDGILGGSFLDEAEIEQTLNNLGEEGWELVSFLDGSAGLFGVFKQMFRQPNGVAEPVVSPPLPQNEQDEIFASSFREEEKPDVSCFEEDDAAEEMTKNLETELLQEDIVVEEEAETAVVATEAVFVSSDEEDLSSGTEPEQDEEHEESVQDYDASGIGSIRIE